MYGAARGLTDVLDPHSRFMDPDEYGKLKKETEGNEEIDGIGIDVEKRKNRFVIISPIEGSPAARAGIEPGDVIKRVDGADVSTLEFDDAVSRMQGPSGSEVTLVVERRGRDLTFRIRRARYEVKAVEGKLVEEGVGYIKIRVFSSTTDGALGESARPAFGQVEGAAGPGAGSAPQPRGAARSGGSRGRSVHRRRAHRQDRRQGRTRDGRGQGAQPRHLVRFPDDRAGRRGDRLGRGDRRRRAAGPRPRGRARDADVRKGLGADGHRSRRLRQQPVRSQADRRPLLHPERTVDPGSGDYPEHPGRGDRAARPIRARAISRASAICTSGCATSRATRRRRRGGSTTTSCRWRSTTCGRGRCSRSSSAGSSGERARPPAPSGPRSSYPCFCPRSRVFSGPSVAAFGRRLTKEEDHVFGSAPGPGWTNTSASWPSGPRRRNASG